MIDNPLTEDMHRLTATLDPLIHELRQESADTAVMIASLLDLDARSVPILLAVLQDCIHLLGAPPTDTALRLGLLIGGRLAPANADEAHLAA